MAANETKPETVELPPVLIHRLPTFNFPSLKDLLLPHFHLIDPLDSPDSQPPSPLRSFPCLDQVRALGSVGNPLINSGLLSLLPPLELVVATSSGLDHVDLKEIKNRGITLTNASETLADDLADHAVGLLIDVFRRLSAADRYVRAGLWPVKGDYTLDYKRTIVSLGSTGFEVAKSLLAFGCSIA